MSFKSYFSLISILTLGFSPQCCHAAELTLSAAMAEALAHNPEMRSLAAGVAGAKGGVTTARTFANPELSIAPGIKHVSEGSVSTNEFHGNFEISQLFQFPGKRALKIAIAERNVNVQQLALEGFRFELSAKVRRAFYDFLTAQKVVGLRHEQVNSAETFAESARKRAESGYASDFETVKSRADLITAERALIESKEKVAATRVMLNTLLGRSPATSLAVTGALEQVEIRPASQEEFVALAMARNPILRTLGVQAETAGLTLRATRFARRPDFAIAPQVEYTQSEQIYGVGVTVALPLWDQRRGEIQTATAEQQKALAEIGKTRLEITGAVTKASESLEFARNQLALYTPEFLRQLRSFVVQAEQGYAQSATTLIIFLDAKRTYFDTLSSYYEALGKVAASRAELESAIGVPLETTKP